MNELRETERQLKATKTRQTKQMSAKENGKDSKVWMIFLQELELNIINYLVPETSQSHVEQT